MQQKSLLTRAVLASTLFVSTLSVADPISDARFTTQLTSTTLTNSFEITPTGSVTVENFPAIQIDTEGGKITIFANNLQGENAVKTLGAMLIAPPIVINHDNAILTVGANSGINSAGMINSSPAVLLSKANNTLIDNAGIITNTGADSNNAIQINNSSTNTTIRNAQSGVIEITDGVQGATIFQIESSPGLTIINAGKILQPNAGQITLQFNDSLTQLLNKSGGLINQTGGNGGFVVEVAGGGVGSIHNERGATLSATLGSTNTLALTQKAFEGNIINEGAILSDEGAALLLDSSLQGYIFNSGLIQSNTPSQATLVANENVNISQGLTNFGVILAKSGTTAIDLSKAFVTLRQNGGLIGGDVLLGVKASSNLAGEQDVFYMNGGKINGSIVAQTSEESPNFNSLNLQGGIINGDVFLGNRNDVLNLFGTQVYGGIHGGDGDNIIHAKGGDFSFLEGGKGNNTLFIEDSFAPGGPINNIGNIEIQNTGTVFTVDYPILGLDGLGLTIQQGEMRLASTITGKGNIINNSVLTIKDWSPTLIDLSAGNGTVTSHGTLEVTLNQKIATSSKLLVNASVEGAVNLSSDSIIKAKTAGFIFDGATFDIIQVEGGGSIIAENKVISPSLMVNFSQSLNSSASILTLKASRNSYTTQSSTQVTPGVARTLDVIAQNKGLNNSQFLDLLGELDSLPSQLAIEQSLESLTPPANYGLVAGSHIGMDTTFESVIARLGQLGKTVHMGSTEPQSGINSGDGQGGSFWIQGLGAHLNQKERQGIAGYKAKGGGVALGSDWDLNDCTTLGLVASYTKVSVDDKNIHPKDQNIHSWQATAYGWWQWAAGWYLDAMFGAATNHYKTNRVIDVNQIQTATRASFDGAQWGAQADLGWSYDCNLAYYAPFVRLKYIALNLKDYSEEGAGAFDLQVQNANTEEFLGGIGIRIGNTFERRSAWYVPEISAMIAYDFKNDGEQTLAGFLGGGPAFNTDGLIPGRVIFDLGIGLNAYLSDCSILEAKYNLELRSQFVSNALYLQYHFLWS